MDLCWEYFPLYVKIDNLFRTWYAIADYYSGFQAFYSGGFEAFYSGGFKAFYCRTLEAFTNGFELLIMWS